MAQDIPQLIASARGFLTSQAYGADERPVLIAVVDQLEKAHAALKSFATASIDNTDPVKAAVEPNGYRNDLLAFVERTAPEKFVASTSTLTIDQFERARAAFQGEA